MDSALNGVGRDFSEFYKDWGYPLLEHRIQPALRYQRRAPLRKRLHSGPVGLHGADTVDPLTLAGLQPSRLLCSFMYASRAACFASCLLLPNRAKFDSWCCRPPKIRFALLFNFQDWCGTLPPWCRCNLMWLAVKNRSVLVSRISYGLITV